MGIRFEKGEERRRGRQLTLKGYMYIVVAVDYKLYVLWAGIARPGIPHLFLVRIRRRKLVVGKKSIERWHPLLPVLGIRE